MRARPHTSSVIHAAIVTIVLVGCSTPAEPPLLLVRTLFASSFESDADSAGWSGYGGWSVQHDAPPGGGGHSLIVSGGCIAPHLDRRLAIPAGPCSVTISFWAKNLAVGGAVSLRTTLAPQREMVVPVTDTVWTRYAPVQAIACQRGDTVVLELMSGGIVYSAMAIDLLEVRTIE